MHIENTLNCSEKISYTARLLSVSDPLFDRSVSMIRKVAVAIFSALVIPVAILFALVADGIYYIFPNLRRSEPLPELSDKASAEDVPTNPQDIIHSAPVVEEPLQNDPLQIDLFERPLDEIQQLQSEESTSTDLPQVELTEEPVLPLDTQETQKPVLEEKPRMEMSESQSTQPSSPKGWSTIGKVALAAAGVGILAAGAYALYFSCPLPPEVMPAIVNNSMQPALNTVLDSGKELVSAVNSSSLVPSSLIGLGSSPWSGALFEGVRNVTNFVCKLRPFEFIKGALVPGVTSVPQPPPPNVDLSVSLAANVSGDVPCVPTPVTPTYSLNGPDVPTAVNVSSTPPIPPLPSIEVPCIPNPVIAPAPYNVSNVSASLSGTLPAPKPISRFAAILGVIASLGGLISIMRIRRDLNSAPKIPDEHLNVGFYFSAPQPIPEAQAPAAASQESERIELTDLDNFIAAAPHAWLMPQQVQLPVEAEVAPPQVPFRPAADLLERPPSSWPSEEMWIAPELGYPANYGFDGTIPRSTQMSERVEPRELFIHPNQGRDPLSHPLALSWPTLEAQGFPASENLEIIEEVPQGGIIVESEDPEWAMGNSVYATDGLVGPSEIAAVARAVKPGDESKGLKYVFSLASVKDALGEESGQIMEGLRAYVATKQNDPAFLESEAAQCAKSLYNAIAVLNQPMNLQSIRDSYKPFIHESRKALMLAKKLGEVPEFLQRGIDYLKQAHHAKYTSVSMYHFYVDFIKKALVSSREHYEMPELNLVNVAGEIQRANDSLKRVNLHPDYLQDYIPMQWKKLQGTAGVYFDPSADSNTPWVHSHQRFLRRSDGAEKQITVLRHGTPTRDPGFFGALYRESLNLMSRIFNFGNRRDIIAELVEVAPEYRAHLEANPLAQHLYINHQEYTESNDRSLHGEANRSLALQALQKDHKNFHFASFPLDGVIWKKRWLAGVSMGQLRQTLLYSLKNGENGFTLPAGIDLDESLIQRMLIDIQALYFGKESLNIHEKTAFIMIFYSYLKNYLKAELNVDFIVSACKDNKDRGNASTITDMIVNMMLLGEENDPDRLKELFFSALGPFIIKNDNIISERLEMALVVIDQIAKLSEDRKDEIRDHFVKMTGWEIINQIVPKDVGQSLKFLK